MSMFSFLPIFILIFILMLVFVPAFSPIIKWKRIGFFSKLNTKWMSGVYCLLLLISFTIFYLLPSDIYSYSDEEFGSLSPNDVEYDTNAIYDALYKGKIEQTEGVNTNETWEFFYSGDQLSINMNEDPTSMLIIAERSDELKGKIEATHYTSKAFIQGLDFSDELHPPYVKLEGETLIIQEPAPLELDYYKLQKEFVITQFDSNKKDHRYIMETSIGVNVLYLKIPKDLEIIGNILYVVE
ncbi:hypothetical protein JOC85_000977 [Bacillus mesophilus]|uniref:Uncharacterized protein n=1 Tax=Bacillus mesophilus TaxID=1808955 RepID=A0A6M0Q554_9BACI|nr:hypothetical protein [Bacillus mesophilus]MBM7660210.1 hypothetical protein [Bacillus mesophilus]NEY70929.1 hypothetical protein [Bacillus mesophilus]